MPDLSSIDPVELFSGENGLMVLLILLVLVIIGFVLMVLPLKMAAKAVGAENTGMFACFLALIVASILQAIGSLVPVFGNLVAFLLGAAGFAGILKTSFVRGIAMAVLHMLFSILIVVLIVAVMGGLGVLAA
jgi:hypothetical protein